MKPFSSIRSHFFESIDSSNNWIKRQIQDFSSLDLQIVCAKAQTNGRGTRGKSWHSPEQGNLYASFLFCTELFKKKQAVLFSQIFSYSLLQLIEQKNITLCFKWPNDFLLNSKKIGGLLCESLRFSDGKEALIIGLGLNLAMDAKNCQKIDQEASSIYLETKIKISSKEILEEITRAFLEELQRFQQNPNIDYSQKIAQFDALLGKKVALEQDGKTWEGQHIGLTKNGALLLKTNENSKLSFYSGKLKTMNLMS